jgi:hypothetical protein
MKTETQANAELAHIARLIEDMPFAMMATVEADGALASRPSKMVRAFGVIASTVAGKPIAMGEHGSHIGLSSAA